MEHLGPIDVGRIMVRPVTMSRRLGRGERMFPALSIPRPRVPRRCRKSAGRAVLAKSSARANSPKVIVRFVALSEMATVFDLQPGAVRFPATAARSTSNSRAAAAPLRTEGTVARRGAAAGGHAVVGHMGRVGHNEQDARRVHSQFLGGGLRDFGPRALPYLNFARHYSNRSVAVDVQPSRDIRRPASAESPPAAASAAALGQRHVARYGNQQPRRALVRSRAA